MKRRSRHFPMMALCGSPFFQSTLIFLSITNRRHHFFSSRTFLNHYSPIVGKPIARAMYSSVISNSNEPTLAWPLSNIFVSSSTMAMLKPSNFYKNGRNLDSCNSARLIRYSAVFSISFKDNGSFLIGSMFKFITNPCHNLKRILMSDTNSS